ncbi:hypothetical protein L6452_32308 [Arctium lappa]|uniref:Uncharacterized protein n=1 Tax=Arctium lappa TaxID=4217 RepID=A0ACB8Z3Z2_ARCLA|nr:hypothetical protein L6452_32308 [Arctium lappa]
MLYDIDRCFELQLLQKEDTQHTIITELQLISPNPFLHLCLVLQKPTFVDAKFFSNVMRVFKTFIANLNAQLSEWLEAGKLQRIVIVIMSKATNEVFERWNFSIETNGEVVEKGVSREKSDKEIMREIQAIMRQIASSITYLPCLDEPSMAVPKLDKKIVNKHVKKFKGHHVDRESNIVLLMDRSTDRNSHPHWLFTRFCYTDGKLRGL